jgi:hypothetical protein
MRTEAMSLPLIENALWEKTKSRERFRNEYYAKDFILMILIVFKPTLLNM